MSTAAIRQLTPNGSSVLPHKDKSFLPSQACGPNLFHAAFPQIPAGRWDGHDNHHLILAFIQASPALWPDANFPCKFYFTSLKWKMAKKDIKAFSRKKFFMELANTWRIKRKNENKIQIHWIKGNGLTHWMRCAGISYEACPSEGVRRTRSPELQAAPQQGPVQTDPWGCPPSLSRGHPACHRE